MRFPWRSALGFALGAAGLYWAFHDVSWDEFTAAMRDSDVVLWTVAVVVSQLIFPLRALRWRPILHSVAPDLPLMKLWRATALGIAINNVVPARAGEVARAYALAHEEPRVSFPAALGSLVVDRVFDALIIVLLILVALLDPRFSSVAAVGEKTVGGLVVFGVISVVGGFGILYLSVFAPAQVQALAGAIVRRIAPKHELRARELARAFTAGLGVLRDPGRFVAVFLWAAAHWLVCGAAFWISFKALGIDVPLTAALLVQGLIALGAAAPQAPGYFGTFEFAGKIALGAYLIPDAKAAAWAISFHVLTMIPITLIGLWYFVKLGVSLGEIRRAEGVTVMP